MKCKKEIRSPDRRFEEQIAKGMKTNKKQFSTYIVSKKDGRESIGPPDCEE